MKELVHKKAKVVALRKQGLSYKEIIERTGVAKSTLSSWLKDAPLTKNEKRLLQKNVSSRISKGRLLAAAAHRKSKRERDDETVLAAQKEFPVLSKDSLFQVGVALYWAEGAKRNSMCHFMNADEDMVSLMLLWFERFAGQKRDDLGYRLYVHQPYQHENWEKWWQEYLNVPPKCFKKTIIKPTGLQVKKRPNYRGCMRVEVPRSTKLLLKIKVWSNMLVEYQRK